MTGRRSRTACHSGPNAASPVRSRGSMPGWLVSSASMPAARSFSSPPAAAPASSACRHTRAASPITAASSGSSTMSGST